MNWAPGSPIVRNSCRRLDGERPELRQEIALVGEPGELQPGLFPSPLQRREIDMRGQVMQTRSGEGIVAHLLTPIGSQGALQAVFIVFTVFTVHGA